MIGVHGHRAVMRPPLHPITSLAASQVALGELEAQTDQTEEADSGRSGPEGQRHFLGSMLCSIYRAL
jgi:hypothetical protein